MSLARSEKQESHTSIDEVLSNLTSNQHPRKQIDLYPQGLEMTSLQVPKNLKTQIQAICIELAWGRNEEARKLIE